MRPDARPRRASLRQVVPHLLAAGAFSKILVSVTRVSVTLVSVTLELESGVRLGLGWGWTLVTVRDLGGYRGLG